MLVRAALAMAMAIPIWLGLSIVCYIAFCLTVGPWGGAMETVDPQDVPAYLPWLRRLLLAMLIVASLLLGWRLATKLTRASS